MIYKEYLWGEKNGVSDIHQTLKDYGELELRALAILMKTTFDERLLFEVLELEVLDHKRHRNKGPLFCIFYAVFSAKWEAITFY